MSKPYVLLFDIDGVLADWSHRLHFIKRQNWQDIFLPDWDAFYAAMPDDPVLPGAIIYNLLVGQSRFLHRQVSLGKAACEYPVVDCVTCRPEKMRCVTVDWFERNGLLQPRVIHMRRDDDMRPHHEIKVEIWKKHYERVETVLAIFDDNAETIAAFKELGVTAYHVT